MKNTIPAEYLHTVHRRRVLVPLASNHAIPVTVEGVTLDPDASQIVLLAGTPFGHVYLRFEATDLIQVEA